MSRPTPRVKSEDAILRGRRIAHAREMRGFSTQAMLAEALGKCQPTVANWERGYAAPRLGDVPQLAQILGEPPAWLAWGDEKGFAR